MIIPLAIKSDIKDIGFQDDDIHVTSMSNVTITFCNPWDHLAERESNSTAPKLVFL